jgi:choice-of-anchor A domain-containing protein
MTGITRFRLAAITLVAVASATSPAWPACPQVPCDCFGAALNYAGIGAEGAQITMGRYGAGSRANGDVCASTAFVGSKPYNLGADTSTGSLILLKAIHNAAILVGACHVSGDVVTGGGSVLQRGLASVSGTIDTSGTDPRLDSCEQAITDAASASAFLAGLTPTRDLGSIRVTGGDILVLNADPGVNVWTATDIVVRAPGPDGITNGVVISFAPDTDAVILNVSRVLLSGIGAGIYVGGSSGSEHKLIVNVPGEGPAVVVKGYGQVEGFLLAPQRKVRDTADMLQIFAGQLHLRGGYVRPIACP